MAASNGPRMLQSPSPISQEPEINEKENLSEQELSGDNTQDSYLHDDEMPVGDFPGDRALMLLPEHKSSIIGASWSDFQGSSRLITSYGLNNFVECSRLFESLKASLVYETKKVPDISYYCTTSDTQYDCTHHQVGGVNIEAVPEDHHSSLPIQLSSMLVTGLLSANQRN